MQSTANRHHHVLLLEQRDGLRRLVHTHGGAEWAWHEANSIELTGEYARLGETPWLASEVAEATRQASAAFPRGCQRWTMELLRTAGIPLQDGAQTKLWRAIAVRPEVL